MRLRHVLVPFAAAAALVLAGCASDAPSTTEPPAASASASASASAPAAADGCDYTPGSTASRDVNAPDAEPTLSGDVPAAINTSAGEITLTLTADRTPCTVNSFASLAEQGYFDATQCHRLTTSGIFVLQCGDPTATGTGGPGYSFADELDGTETYPAGTVAMANAGPGTNGSQFFLVYEDTKLQPDYTVFGQLSEDGLAIVREIADKGAVDGEPDGAPAEPVEITTVSVG